MIQEENAPSAGISSASLPEGSSIVDENQTINSQLPDEENSAHPHMHPHKESMDAAGSRISSHSEMNTNSNESQAVKEHPVSESTEPQPADFNHTDSANNYHTSHVTRQDRPEEISSVEGTTDIHPPVVHQEASDMPVVEIHESNTEEFSDEVAAEESYSHLSRKELLAKLEELLKQDDILSLRKPVREIRDCFLNLTKEERKQQEEKIKAVSEDDETDDEKQVQQPDEFHEQFVNLLRAFNHRLYQLQQTREKEQKANLLVKKQIIDEIRQLADSAELNFKQIEKLHELQNRWRSTGLVPTGESNNLWEDYRFNTGRFYERLKIDKELRELDQKKNLVAKNTLCEKAEENIIEPSLKTALETARELQQAWKEIGPVPKEINESLWQRFSAALDKVFQRQREYIESRREDHAQSVQLKEALIAEMQKISETQPLSHKEWLEVSQQAEQLMEKWKLAGFANKDKNEELWNSFKALRDIFYKSREKFYAELRQALSHNLKLKQDICEQAENLATSTDWKNVGNTIRQLQEQWKSIGPVSKKHSDKVWARFRKACDSFFENKKLHFADEVEQQSKNLELKNQLISKIETFELLDNNNDTITALKQFQNEWMGIGHVPFKEKESLNSRYRKVIDKKFEEVRARVGDNQRSLFTMKYQSMKNDSRGTEKLSDEKQKIRDRIGRLNQEILQAENNMGFFAKSANAESILKDARSKVENTKREIQKLKDQLKIIDQTQQGVTPKKEDVDGASAQAES
jgi:enolase